MSAKKSVFLSDSSVSWIEETTNSGEGPKWSESINSSIEQFRFLLRESLPVLSVDEWQTIINVYSSCYAPAYGVPARIASDIMDDIGVVDIADLAEETAELVRKLHAMPQLEQLAILYVAQVFWLNDWSSYKNFSDILADIRAKL